MSFKFKKILYTPVYSEKALFLQKYYQYIFYINTNLSKKILKVFFESKFNIKIKSIKTLKISKKFKKSIYTKKVILKVIKNFESIFLSRLFTLL